MANERLAIALALPGYGVTQFESFPFQSFGNIAGQDIACNEDGLYVLGGSDDDGTAISADLDICHDFGQVIRVRSIWIGFETTGNIKVTATMDDRTNQQRIFNITAYQKNNRQHGRKIFLGRGDQGRYLKMRFENVSGADLSLDNIEAIIINLGRRHPG